MAGRNLYFFRPFTYFPLRFMWFSLQFMCFFEEIRWRKNRVSSRVRLMKWRFGGVWPSLYSCGILTCSSASVWESRPPLGFAHLPLHEGKNPQKLPISSLTVRESPTDWKVSPSWRGRWAKPRGGLLSHTLADEQVKVQQWSAKSATSLLTSSRGARC